MRNPLPPGSRIHEYKIVRVLGTGGFGITYLALDQMLDGWVALKEYFPVAVAVRTDDVRVVASTEGRDVFGWGLDRFLKEARAIHQLRHPSIVRVRRYVERHTTAYIVMEYVEGESLASILESRGRLSENEWQPWFDRPLDGLAHVHDHDYLHRDIKPANIVIRASDGEPVLIDFGAARVASQQRTHTQVLTPGYAPYEQHTRDLRDADRHLCAGGGLLPGAHRRASTERPRSDARRLLRASGGTRGWRFDRVAGSH